MSKQFFIDYEGLSNSIDKKFYKLSEVKDKLEKVAFDIFKMKDSSPDELWQIQSADDGEYIVARYETEAPKETAVKSDWDAIVVASKDVNIFYKGHPITKIASNKLGSDVDVNSVGKFLPNLLNTDKSFVKALFASLDLKIRQDLFKLYPELQ